MALEMFKTAASRGVGMIVLQVLRAFSVITLFSSAASCWILLINIDNKRSWFPFEGASLFFLSCLPLFLILSEFPMIRFIRNYFERNWPAVGPEAGLGWLGTGMAVIGCNLLGKLNQAAFDTKNLGDSFRQLVMAAGILNLIFGVLNLLCNFIWGDRKSGISARQVRSKGSLANSDSHDLPKYTLSDAPSRSSSTREEKTRSKFVTMFWKNNNSPTTATRPAISHPMPGPHDYGTNDDEERGSPIAPGVKRPDTALHPINTRTSSRYSADRMSRF
jgi:hypothetical protein